MSEESLNQKLRLGLHYWIVFGVTAPIVLFLFKPWQWELPEIAKIAGILGLPFIFSIITYVVVLFLYEILIARSVGKSGFQALAVVVVFATCGAAAITYVKGFAPYRSLLVLLLTASTIVLFEIVHPRSR
jgi:hypothetical protein